MSQKNLSLYYIAEHKTRFSLIILQLHYTTCLSLLQTTNFCYPFDIKLNKISRALCQEVVGFLKDESFRNELWNSLCSETMSDKSREIYILESIKSNRIIEALIGRTFFKRIVEVSKYPIGRHFLYRVIYSNGGGLIAKMIKEEIHVLKEYIADFDSESARILSLLFNQYKVFLDEIQCHAPLQELNDIIIFTTNVYKPVHSSILKIIIRILCDEKLISKGEDISCEGIIAGFASQICTKYIDNPSIGFQDTMEMLEPCMKYTICSEQIAMNSTFCASLLQEMNCDNNKRVYRAWHFFNKLVKGTNILTIILRSSEISKSIQSIASNESPLVFRKFSKFIIRLTVDNRKSQLDMLEGLISSSIGRIACTYKNSQKIFSNFPEARLAANEMVASVLNTEGQFKKALSHHLASLAVDIKKITSKKQRPK